MRESEKSRGLLGFWPVQLGELIEMRMIREDRFGGWEEKDSLV